MGAMCTFVVQSSTWLVAPPQLGSLLLLGLFVLQLIDLLPREAILLLLGMNLELCDPPFHKVCQKVCVSRRFVCRQLEPWV